MGENDDRISKFMILYICGFTVRHMALIDVSTLQKVKVIYWPRFFISFRKLSLADKKSIRYCRNSSNKASSVYCPVIDTDTV